MRFGIMAMQLEALIPAGLPSEQVLARVSSFNLPELVRQLFGLGFNPIELGGDLPMFLPHTFSPDVIGMLASLKEELGVSYTMHLPLWSVEPSTPLTPVRSGSVEALVNAVCKSLPLEPEIYVLHSTGALAAEFYSMKLPQVAKAVILDQFQNNARQSLQALLVETGIPSRRLAIETIEFPFERTLALAEELDLSVCFDAGHVLVGFSGPIDFFQTLERCLPRLAEVHLHDSPSHGSFNGPGYGLDHRKLGDGDLDVARLLDRLDQVAFQGPMVYELSVEEALESMQYIRNLRPGAGVIPFPSSDPKGLI
jgi:sugar phosphate isomerase/epimerase